MRRLVGECDRLKRLLARRGVGGGQDGLELEAVPLSDYKNVFSSPAKDSSPLRQSHGGYGDTSVNRSVQSVPPDTHLQPNADTSMNFNSSFASRVPEEQSLKASAKSQAGSIDWGALRKSLEMQEVLTVLTDIIA